MAELARSYAGVYGCPLPPIFSLLCLPSRSSLSGLWFFFIPCFHACRPTRMHTPSYTPSIAVPSMLTPIAPHAHTPPFIFPHFRSHTCRVTLGARMMGGGFGGCCIVLVDPVNLATLLS
jgi:hypothetical protein